MKTVSVIIATTADPRRQESLTRAVESVQTQQGVTTKLILVVNGPRCDAVLPPELQRLPLHVIRLPEPSLPAAIGAGRLAVESDHFSFLDDDDVYLPGALAARVDALESANADVLVSNGRDPAGNLIIPDVALVERDRLKALLSRNWLASCAGLYRSADVSAEYFQDLVKYFEWTVLAFRLVMAGKRISFVNDVTYQISDTEGSASKQRSMESALNGVAVVEYMIAHVPEALRASLSWRRAAAYHQTSDTCLSSGDLAQAWRMHATSIRLGGWRYLAYTRKLIRHTFQGMAPRLGEH